MIEALIGFAAAVLGAVLGSAFTWHISKSLARNESRRTTLAKLMRDIEDIRVAYAVWYTEYLYPNQGKVGAWAKPSTGNPDPIYLHLMGSIDRARGELRVDCGFVYALFPNPEKSMLAKGIQELLIFSSGDLQEKPSAFDKRASGFSDSIPDVIKKYS